MRKTGFFPESGKLPSRRAKRLSEGLRPAFEAVKEAVVGSDAGVDEGVVASGKRNDGSASAVDGFWCSGTQLCIWKNSTCDDVDSCLDGGSDESDCEPETTATTTTTTTTTSTTTATTASSSSLTETDSTDNSIKRTLISDSNTAIAMDLSLMDDFKVEREAAAQESALTNQSGTAHVHSTTGSAGTNLFMR